MMPQNSLLKKKKIDCHTAILSIMSTYILVGFGVFFHRFFGFVFLVGFCCRLGILFVCFKSGINFLILVIQIVLITGQLNDGSFIQSSLVA